MPGISPEADQEKEEAKQEQYEKEYIRGAILDRKGKAIAWTDQLGAKRQYLDSRAFSDLIGYQSLIYGNSGVERTMNQYLVKSASKGKEKRGSDLTLTLDADLQMYAYEAIKKTRGSVVVLDAKTGEILVLASSKSYDITAIEDKWEEINSQEGSLLSNAYQNPVAPGSVFKVVTAKAILENGLEKEDIEDQGYLVVDGQTIHNYNGNAYGTIDFEQGFVNSSNVYFMDRGLKLGAKIMSDAGKDFLLGENIPLDFTTLKSSFDLSDASKNVLAATCFGQGETLVTPLQMAMVTQSIANEGKMMKPYLFSSAVNGKGKTVYEGSSEILKETMDKKTAQKLKNVMVEAANHYEMSAAYGQIAAKTGTAQRGDGTNNAWMITFAPADDPRYVIVANQLGTKEIGKTLSPVIESLYKRLLQQ